MKFRFQAYILRGILEDYGYSARKFAAKIGVSEAYVSSMLNGKAGFPASRAHVFPEGVCDKLRVAAETDFGASWLVQYNKGLQEAEAKGKARRHEKTKAKKQKRKT